MNNDISKKFKKFVSVHNYSFKIQGSETHWYFIEGAHAYKEELYLASLLAFFNGIESSIRATLMYINVDHDQNELSGKVLSNGLLKDAQKIGLNIDILAFPNEIDFHIKLLSKKTPVELVRNRNNLCHGNVFEYIKEISDANEKIFTPECLKDLATTINIISESWATEIGNFRNNHLEA